MTKKKKEVVFIAHKLGNTGAVPEGYEKHHLPQVDKKIVKSLIKHDDTPRQALEQFESFSKKINQLSIDISNLQHSFDYLKKVIQNGRQ